MLSLAVHAATAQYESEATASANLDTSTAGLAAATTTVVIGATPNFWFIPTSPYPPYTVCVGDKLSFMYGVAHNVWLMTDGPDCDYPFTSPGFFLGDATYGGGGVDGLPANNYEVVVKAAGTLHIACQAGAHCANGQKVTITVEEGDCTRVIPDDPPTPPPPPPPSPPPTPPLEENAASASGPTSWVAVVLATVATLAVWTSGRDAGEV